MSLNKVKKVLDILFPPEKDLPSGFQTFKNSTDSTLKKAIRDQINIIDMDVNCSFKRTDLMSFLAKNLGPHEYRIFLLNCTEIFFGDKIIHNYIYDVQSPLAKTNRVLPDFEMNFLKSY